MGSLAAAAIILQYLFTTTLERSVREDLEAAMTRLIALIDLETSDLALTAPMPDPRYDTPLGGRYWQIENTHTGEMLRSRSLWDTVIPATAGDADGHQHFAGDQDLHLIYITRFITADGRPLQVSLGEDHLPVHLATVDFQHDVFRLFLILGAVILAAAWLQLSLGLAPLNRLRRAIDEIRQGRTLRLGQGFPGEVRPLVNEVNALLDERETNIQRARQRASDLAHGLNTPLAALHGIAQRVRDRGNAPDADLIDDLAFEMSKRIDYQMRLSALRLRTGNYTESASINTAILRTITVLKKTGRGERLHWVAEMSGDWQVDIHRQDLIELVGVVLENAAKWATSRVVVHTTISPQSVTLHVADDGPGIPPEQLAQLGERGRRFDETMPGSGHGLAIVSEILVINNGRIEFGRSEQGGLLVRVTLRRADH
ncbi:sensor histidine kinase [Devosia sp. CAU 1758]